jgi:hypothetical protein
VQQLLHDARIKIHNTSKETGQVCFLRREESRRGVRLTTFFFTANYVVSANEILAEGRRPAEREHQRTEKRDRHGDRERAKKAAGNTSGRD